MLQKKSNPWVKRLNIIIQNLGLSYLSNDNLTIKPLFGFIKQRLTDQGFQEQHANISESPTLIFFQSVYKINERAGYVDALKNRSDRSSLCKLRVSAHNLAIERGRYLKMPRDQRICEICKSGEIENEQHMLLHCSGYSSIRESFVLKMFNITGKSVTTLCDKNIINLILNNTSYKALKLSSSFVTNCFNARSNLL